MKDIQNGLDVQNISDLVLKEISGIYKIKSLTKEQIKRYKMTKREIVEKFHNLSEDELNAKNNKQVYAKNDIITYLLTYLGWVPTQVTLTVSDNDFPGLTINHQRTQLFNSLHVGILQ